MLLTELILSKRGPLAKVWLSAHQERKLNKQQTLGVDVGESVDAILEQDDGPIALRLSGQLMLGVTRIYSRKVQYLLDDCEDTRKRITVAFQPGIVDLPEDQIRASKNAITISDTTNDFNFMDWSWASAPIEITSRGLHTVPQAQINLRTTTKEFGAYNFGRPTVPSIYGRSSTSRHGSQDDTTSHLDSQDFSGIDLGLTGDLDVEMRREVRSNLSDRQGSVGKRFGSIDIGQDVDMGMDTGFEGIDLGLEMAEQPELPPLETRSRRETSALSTPPPASPPHLVAEFTPRTAARLNKPVQAPKPKRLRMLHADDELELPDEDFAAPSDGSMILGNTHYIPSDPELVRLRSIAADPSSYFLPTISVGGTNMIYAGPQGLAPELTELFAFPTNVLRRNRSEDDLEPASKRPRIGSEPADMEVARRGSVLPPSEHAFDLGLGDHTFDTIQPGDYGMDIQTGDDYMRPGYMTPRKAASIAPSRAESIARSIQFGVDPEHPLSMFDPRRSESQSIHETPTKSVISEQSRGGYSKNTGMAMGLLRKEIEAIAAEDKVVEFDSLAAGSSKKAASAFFFELLVLGTKDCVRLEQDRAFENIKIRSKPKLFQDLSA